MSKNGMSNMPHTGRNVVNPKMETESEAKYNEKKEKLAETVEVIKKAPHFFQGPYSSNPSLSDQVGHRTIY